MSSSSSSDDGVAALSDFTYYVLGFLYILYTRRFATPLFALLLFVFHYWIWGGLVSDATALSFKYRYAKPLFALGSGLLAYWLAYRINFRRMLFLKNCYSYGLWTTFSAVQFILMQGALVAWELEGTFVKPLNFIATIVLWVLIIALCWTTRGWSFWAYKKGTSLRTDDYACDKFYGILSLYLFTAAIISAIARWSAPGFAEHWTMLIVFGFHALITLLLSVFVFRDKEVAGVEEAYNAVRTAVATSKGGAVFADKGAKNDYEMVVTGDKSV